MPMVFLYCYLSLSSATQPCRSLTESNYVHSFIFTLSTCRSFTLVSNLWWISVRKHGSTSILNLFQRALPLLAATEKYFHRFAARPSG